MTPSVGVVIGRFQVDEITDGHRQLLKVVQDKHQHFCIMLGCARTPAHRDNPLNLRIRMTMLQAEFPHAIIIPIYDRQLDAQWSRDVDYHLMAAFPGQACVLYGGRDSFIPHYQGKYITRQLDFGTDGSSGSDRRLAVAHHHPNTPDFRAGMIAVLHSLPPQVVPCVDIGVIREPFHTHVLLGRKGDEIGWRLPGGMVDTTDKSYRDAALRELKEETAIEKYNLHPLGSFTVDDWRVRGRADIRFFTTLFAIYHDPTHGLPKAADDLADLDWFSWDDAEKQIIDFHAELLGMVRNWHLNQRAAHSHTCS